MNWWSKAVTLTLQKFTDIVNRETHRQEQLLQKKVQKLTPMIYAAKQDANDQRKDKRS
jgi:hypothetical protein